MFWTVFFACLLSQFVGGFGFFALAKLVERFYRQLGAKPRVISTPLTPEELAVLESIERQKQTH